MDRPVMNPVFEDEPAPPRLADWLPNLLTIVKSALVAPQAIVRAFGRALSVPIRFHKSADESPVTCRSVLYGLLCQLATAGVLLLSATIVIVYLGTHPALPLAVRDPSAEGMFFRDIKLKSRDGAPLGGWMIPSLEAREVIESRDKIIGQLRPAVILVHDTSQSREQTLPLARSLHRAGFAVLILATRGEKSELPAARTFGLHEAWDVQASVVWLRGQPGVDPQRLAILGVGSGASACLLATRESGVQAAVAIDALTSGDDAMLRLAGVGRYAMLMQSLCRLVFETEYGVDLRDLDAARQNIPTYTATLQLEDHGLRRETCNRATAFLRQRLDPAAQQ